MKKVTGIKKVSAETKSLGAHVLGDRLELFLDTRTGELGTEYQISDSSRTEYHTPAIIHVGDIRRPATMAEIREMIDRRLAEIATMEGLAAEAKREGEALRVAQNAYYLIGEYAD